MKSMEPRRVMGRDICALNGYEINLLDTLTHNKTLKGAADELGLSYKVAQNRMAHIREKLFAETTQEAIESFKSMRPA